jgi:hypothetical protein
MTVQFGELYVVVDLQSRRYNSILVARDFAKPVGHCMLHRQSHSCAHCTSHSTYLTTSYIHVT